MLEGRRRAAIGLPESGSEMAMTGKSQIGSQHRQIAVSRDQIQSSREAQAHNRGAVMGTYQAGTSLARVIAPFASGPTYMHIGPSAPFLLAGVVTLQALWCILGVRRAHAAEEPVGDALGRQRRIR